MISVARELIGLLPTSSDVSFRPTGDLLIQVAMRDALHQQHPEAARLAGRIERGCRRPFRERSTPMSVAIGSTSWSAPPQRNQPNILQDVKVCVDAQIPAIDGIQAGRPAGDEISDRSHRT